MNRRIFFSLLLSSALLAAFTLTAGARQAPSAPVERLAMKYFEQLPPDNNVIEAGALFPVMKEGGDMLILDVRSPDDYRKGHLKGAVNLSYFDLSIPEALEKLPTDRPIMVYCYTGQAASQVAVLLNIAGKTAKSIQSGFNHAIIKTEGHETMLEQAVHELPETAGAVAPEVKSAVEDFFKYKMSLEGTPFAQYGVWPKTVSAIMSENSGDYLFVSVRQADAYAKGHLPGALNVPFGRGMGKDLVKLPRDKKIIVYCYTGQTSAQVMTVLRMMGYDAFFMLGGMDAWTVDEGQAKAD